MSYTNGALIDERGGCSHFYVPSGKVIHRMITFEDSNNLPVNMASYDDIIFRINTVTPTEYSMDNGDISVANVNEVTLNFAVDVPAGKYSYSLNAVSAVGEEQKLFGDIVVV